jgi:hypothetical protein
MLTVLTVLFCVHSGRYVLVTRMYLEAQKT